MKRVRAVALPRLLILGAVVLGVHLLLLRASPGPIQLTPPARAARFLIRSIALAPAPVAAAPVPALQPAVLRRPAAVAQRRRPPADLAQATLELLAASAPETGFAPAPVPAAIAGPAIAAAAAPSPAPAAVIVPGPMRLHYQATARVHGFPLSAQAELSWRHDGQEYEATLEISGPLLPTRTDRSTGRITPEGLAPLRFSEKARSEQAAHFERDKGKVSFSSNRPDAPLLAGAQDRLSVMLQLGAMIAGEPRKFRPGTAITIQTAGTRDAEPWVFTVEGQEDLQLPGGKVSALKLIRNPRREFDQKVELWLAPAMDYVPVRLRLTQPNGDSVDQQWSSTDRG
jgi:hypothetical protein